MFDIFTSLIQEVSLMCNQALSEVFCFLYVYVCFACIYVCVPCACLVPVGADESGVRDGCELPPNMSPLKEQLVLLTTVPYL